MPEGIGYSNDPFSVLRKVMPRAQSDEDLATLAAQMAPPPPSDFQPSGAPNPQPAAGARLQGMPNSPLVPGQGQQPPNVGPPPMTQGESRTSPRVGELLLGGGKRGF